MSIRKRGDGDGTIDRSGEGTWRVRYRLNGKRLQKTVAGSKADAQKELRALLRAADVGEHVMPDKMTVGQWIEYWFSIGAPGNKNRKKVGQRTIEGYAHWLRHHVVPELGERPLQQLQAIEIDRLYARLSEKLSPRSCRHVHSVLGACLGTAARTRKIIRNPMLELAKIPSVADEEVGAILDAAQLKHLVARFKNSALGPIVATAAHTGARRGEILALRVCDLDAAKKTLRIERAVEDTKRYGLRFKGPKTERGVRTIKVDDDLVALLVRQKERLQRLQAGIPDGAAGVDLSLIELPADALLFPSLDVHGELTFTRPRRPRNVTKEFARKAKTLGFPELRFHDLRASHETALLDAGVPIHVVAARCGHDPAVMLRAYAKRTHKADTSAASTIAKLFAGAESK
jgi:integrase